MFGSFSAARVESEKSRRTPLYIGIAAAVVVGGILAFVLTRRGSEATPAASPPVATAVPIAADPSAIAAAAVPTAPASLDPRAIEQEVQRQLAQKRQEQAAVPGRPTALSRQAARAATAAAFAAAPEVAPAEPTAAPVPTAPPPEPTQVAVVAPPPEPVEEVSVREEPSPVREQEAAPPPAPREASVSPGDLVGPGPGVVEPALVAPPRIPYPPIARQQRVAGRVVVLVLVGEGGSVLDARLQKGIGGRSGIDGVVVEAVRGSRFRPATKNGVPVKMWRTVVVDVKP